MKKEHFRQKYSKTARRWESSGWFLEAQKNEPYGEKHSVEYRFSLDWLV